MKSVLTIAGSDCGGGAGIQRDISTIADLGLYPMSVITAVTAQNTLGISDILTVSKETVKSQLNSVFADLPPNAVKLGMVASDANVDAIFEVLSRNSPKNIVIDPVMISSSGRRLLNEKGIAKLADKLFPLADIVTPNIPEAEYLSETTITDKSAMITAAKKISPFVKGGVLIKGGHSEDGADDLLYFNSKIFWFKGERVRVKNVHGTGCTLSSAVAAFLALGFSLQESVKEAKNYLSRLLLRNLIPAKGAMLITPSSTYTD